MNLNIIIHSFNRFESVRPDIWSTGQSASPKGQLEGLGGQIDGQEGSQRG